MYVPIVSCTSYGVWSTPVYRGEGMYIYLPIERGREERRGGTASHKDRERKECHALTPVATCIPLIMNMSMSICLYLYVYIYMSICLYFCLQRKAAPYFACISPLPLPPFSFSFSSPPHPSPFPLPPSRFLLLLLLLLLLPPLRSHSFVCCDPPNTFIGM